jgi:hypothetical protein
MCISIQYSNNLNMINKCDKQMEKVIYDKLAYILLNSLLCMQCKLIMHLFITKHNVLLYCLKHTSSSSHAGGNNVLKPVLWTVKVFISNRKFSFLLKACRSFAINTYIVYYFKTIIYAIYVSLFIMLFSMLF